jgi:hypothetical protein
VSIHFDAYCWVAFVPFEREEKMSAAKATLLVAPAHLSPTAGSNPDPNPDASDPDLATALPSVLPCAFG